MGAARRGGLEAGGTALFPGGDVRADFVREPAVLHPEFLHHRPFARGDGIPAGRIAAKALWREGFLRGDRASGDGNWAGPSLREYRDLGVLIRQHIGYYNMFYTIWI